MIYVSAGHIILTPFQPVWSGRPQRELNPAPPHQESRALPTELTPPPPPSFPEKGEYNEEEEEEDEEEDGKGGRGG